MPPAYVKPYVKRQKNDMADAEAICEAVTRANMRFVPTKTPEQQSCLMLHRTRHLRNRVKDSVKFGGNRLLVARSNFPEIPRIGKGHRPDHAVDHRHGNLESHAGRQHPLPTQCLENK